MLGYITTTTCRMEYLRRELDDPAAAPCGRCDNCTGRPWSDSVSAAGATAAGDRLLRPGAVITPRKMWPTGMTDLATGVSGKIPATLSAEPGRALGRLTDLGWGPRLRSLLADGAPDQPVPADFVAALVRVLAAWDWAQRPAAVIALPSRTRPHLIRSLGERIAAIGQLPYLGILEYAAAPDSLPAGDNARQHNSAHRLRAVWNTMGVPEPVAAAVTGLGGPVLLVDDRLETGWTMTVAARLLRAAGAPAVLPLVLAVTS